MCGFLWFVDDLVFAVERHTKAQTHFYKVQKGRLYSTVHEDYSIAIVILWQHILYISIQLEIV